MLPLVTKWAIETFGKWTALVIMQINSKHWQQLLLGLSRYFFEFIVVYESNKLTSKVTLSTTLPTILISCTFGSSVVWSKIMCDEFEIIFMSRHKFSAAIDICIAKMKVYWDIAVITSPILIQKYAHGHTIK